MILALEYCFSLILLNNSIFLRTFDKFPLTLSFEYKSSSAASAENTRVLTSLLKIA